MTSVSEISLVGVPPPAEDGHALGPTVTAWKSTDVPQPRRPSPTPLVVFGLLAGIGAMALGGIAVVSASRSADEAAHPVAPTPRAAPTPRVDQLVLALLAKPSTDRVVFRGSGGRLLLAVGSAGRAAILVRGFERAPAARPYHAWVVASGKPVRAATFTGAERAVFLSAPVGRGDSVVVAPERAEALRPNPRLVAARR